ncbi:hypothetical protein [Malacoplasma iowae]|uniref:hypothetical protein n=1 Tax=Malacoplasma iowae TaxID=2116 RepID=UPI002A18E3AE|nr:hypothetical protein [Malacoplasma iowae]WPL40371.1 hypothetical protein QX183_02355 [Malacoplasma iowae]
MNMISKKKKMIIGSLSVLAGVGAIGGIALGVNPTTNQYTTSTNNGSGVSINDNNKIDLPQAPISSGNQTVVGGENNNSNSSSDANSTALRMTVTKLSSFTREAGVSESYKMTIQNNEQKEGTIYFVVDGKFTTDTITFKPGDKITLRFEANKGYENYTVRDFKISGANESYYVPTKNDASDKRQFIAEMPKYEDTIDKLTGNSWLYAGDTPITINPSFIISDIGENGQTVEWTHGAYMEAINGYVYSFDKDTKFSELLTKYAAFKNDERENPINLFFYLNGYNLIMDANVTKELAEKYAPSGWNLAFFNNSTDSVAKNGKYGSIVLDDSYDGKWTNANVGRFTFNGTMTFGRSLNYRYVNMSDGVQFLNMTDKSISGSIVNEAK